jgi:hypothetical protein
MDLGYNKAWLIVIKIIRVNSDKRRKYRPNPYVEDEVLEV